MQEHFGQSVNLARIKLMTILLHALCVVQTVSLHKLAGAMPTDVDRDSSLRRLQRFFAKYVLDLDIVARMIYEKFYHKLFLHRGEYVYLAGSRIKNSDGIPELQILICFNRPEGAVLTYKKRREIETAFRAMKSSSFNIEDRTPTCVTECVSHVCLRWSAWLLYGRISLVNIKIYTLNR